MSNQKGCKYCIPNGSNDAWLSQPQIDSNRLNSNMNGTLPPDDPKRHIGFSAKIEDYGYNLDKNKEDPKYLEHVQKNPGAIVINSDVLGKKIFPSYPQQNNNPVIMEIGINYCPFCGRKLGIRSTDN